MTTDLLPWDYINNLQPHAIANDYDMANEHEQAGMRESIRTRGIQEPVTLWLNNGHWWILDGRNRYFSAKVVGHKFKPGDFRVFQGTWEQAEEYVADHNNLRRHHSAGQKTEIARKLIAKHPGYSSRRLAQLAGVSHTLIANLRRPAEDPGYANLVRAWQGASYEQQQMFVVAYRIDLTELMGRP
jgi:ParB-like chromosome segregation protein Spo0J